METRHDKLFRQYAQELGKAKLAAEAWWKELIASETKQMRGREEAMGSIKRRWPLGPASHPYIVAIVRKYWLACEKLNLDIDESEDDSGDEESVSPSVFLSEFLLDGKHDKLATFVAPLNYWPIGGDDEETNENV